jgi:hypothetical protein
MVMVMGPTPPGTGLIAEALAATSSKLTSPAQRKPLATTAPPAKRPREENEIQLKQAPKAFYAFKYLEWKD